MFSFKEAYIKINGKEYWRKAFDSGGTQECGVMNSRPDWKELSYPVEIITDTITSHLIKISIETTLRYATEQESFGIANVTIETICPSFLPHHSIYFDDLSGWSVDVFTDCGPYGDVLGGNMQYFYQYMKTNELCGEKGNFKS